MQAPLTLTLLGSLWWILPPVAADEFDDAIGSLEVLKHRFDELQDGTAALVAELRSIKGLAGQEGLALAHSALFKRLRRRRDRKICIDALFLLLRVAGQDEAVHIQALIWEVWLWHPDGSLHQLMQKAMRAMHTDSGFAHDALNTLIGFDPEWAEAWNKRATLRYLTGDFRGSLEDIEEVLKREPRHFGAISGRGMVYSKLGQAREAVSSQAVLQQASAAEMESHLMDWDLNGISADL